MSASDVVPGDSWSSAAQLRAADGLRRRRPRAILWLTALVLGAFIAWAANAPLEEHTRGSGKVAPVSRSQVIQSLDGGILENLSVYEGEEVESGQTLAIINDTTARAAYEDLEGQTIAVKAALARLQAELAEQDAVVFDDEVSSMPEIAEAERAHFESRRRRLVEAVASLEERLELARKELDLVRPLVERGATGVLRQIELERTIADLRGELSEIQNNYFQEVNEEIAKRNAELASLQQQRAQKRDALTRTVLRSPVRGIVKNMKVTTRGGVIRPGEDIMEIVPLDDQLIIEAEIRPQDVAFLHPGQPATVKITAYDFAIYGRLEGELIFISADTIQDENRADAEPYYRVRILTDSASLEGPEGPMPIIPGMVAEVSIQTGSKTVLEYLLKPLLRGQEAFRER